LETKNWKEAAELKIYPANYPWDKFPWQKAIFHFARVMGNVHLNNLGAARKELDTLKILYDTLTKQKNKEIEAAQVSVQITASEAWIMYKEGKHDQARELMSKTAGIEDATEKHPVTPGAVIPARELLGEMLLEMNLPSLALEAFEQDLKLHPNRRNGIAGRETASKKSGNK